MIEITLTKGLKAQIDDADYDLISVYKWFVYKSRNTFYASTYINKKQVLMHRLIMNVTDPKILIDHIDQNGINNQRDNLRRCTQAENYCNRRIPKHKKYTTYLGVILDKRYLNNGAKKWRARIRKNGKAYHLGSFHTDKEAALAYNEGAKKYHGEFARLNIIDP